MIILSKKYLTKEQLLEAKRKAGRERQRRYRRSLETGTTWKPGKPGRPPIGAKPKSDEFLRCSLCTR
jgi:hypothetical protein